MPNSIRHYNFDEIENFRDLGGYECRYGVTHYDVIYRSAAFGPLTERDKEKFKSLNIKSIIDLRDPAAKEKHPDPIFEGVKHYTLNVNGNGRIAKDRTDMIESYFEMLEDPFTARKIFLTLAFAPKPTVIHCTAGKDRTGVFCAIILLLNGVSIDDVNNDYLLSPSLLPKLHAKSLNSPVKIPQEILYPDNEFFLDFYKAFIAKYGTLEEYFDSIGIVEDLPVLESLLGKRERSSGAVIFNGKGEVLVEHMELGHYSLVKGHIEATDKDEIAACLREAKEEVGLDILIKDDCPVMETLYSPYEGIIKTVAWRVADTLNEDIKVDKKEVADAYWLTPEDAYHVLSYTSDRKVLEWAFYQKSKELKA